jgi:hypothetical protein
MRRGGTEVSTVKELVPIETGAVTRSKLVVSKNILPSATGKTMVLDALSSTGANIEWERTSWLIDNQYSRTGPVARLDIPASGEKTAFNYVCTLYLSGQDPLVETGSIPLEAVNLEPVISVKRLSQVQKNVYEFDVLKTRGVNIDWERTDWYFYDGAETITQRRGSIISHAFTLREEQMGYPVMVLMYLKGDSRPFVGYTSIDVAGDALLPIISWQKDSADPNTITFSAENSKGSNIDWTQCRWTFGDSSETG